MEPKPKVSLEPKVNDKRGLSEAHAIRIFKLVQTKTDSIIDSIQQYYPDWEKIIFANSQRKYTKVIVRQKIKPISTKPRAIQFHRVGGRKENKIWIPKTVDRIPVGR